MPLTIKSLHIFIDTEITRKFDLVFYAVLVLGFVLANQMYQV